MRRFLSALLFTAAALAASGCNDTITTPTIPQPVLTTESLDGAVSTAGVYYHVVTARVGEVVLKMEGISDPSIKLGMQIGVYSTLSCTALMDNPAATIGSKLIGTASSMTQLCIAVYDPGTIPADTSIAYHLTISHY
jgi:hypothetical protein